MRIDEIFRTEYGRILATLIRVLGDFYVAEDALQDAFATALEQWPAAGLPTSPWVWLIGAARHKAIDRLRRVARLEAVLMVVYLVFNEGYAASFGDRLVRHDLCEQAIRLGRMLVELLPAHAEAKGLLALMLLHDSRRESRLDGAGEIVLLEEQDRKRWDRAQIDEGAALVEASLHDGGRPPGA